MLGDRADSHLPQVALLSQKCPTSSPRVCIIIVRTFKADVAFLTMGRPRPSVRQICLRTQGSRAKSSVLWELRWRLSTGSGHISRGDSDWRAISRVASSIARPEERPPRPPDITWGQDYTCQCFGDHKNLCVGIIRCFIKDGCTWRPSQFSRRTAYSGIVMMMSMSTISRRRRSFKGQLEDFLTERTITGLGCVWFVVILEQDKENHGSGDTTTDLLSSKSIYESGIY